MSRIRGPIGLLLFLPFLATALASTGAEAQTRTERFRWTHPTPSLVSGFKLYYGTAPGSHPTQINVGLPTPNSNGVYFADVALPAQQGVYAVVTAYNAQGESAVSNEKFRPAPTDGGSGGGTGALSAIAGFTLWNATSDTVVDATFTAGEKIDIATLPCAAIQIRTNAYLGTLNSPGSVKKIFDGQALSCTSAPASHEDNPPYVWESEQGPNQYDCAPSLRAVGTHTLVAIPYDGDNCTGLAGPSATLTFDVINSSSTGGGSGTTLGQPGQPVLVQ